MKTFELEVTGELPIEFEGELLFEQNNKWTENVERDRFHILNVYRTAPPDNCYIVWIQFVTYWQGESDIKEIFECSTLEEVEAELEDYNPIKPYIGLPDEPYYKDRNDKTKYELRFDWKTLKAEALKKLGVKRKRGRQPFGDKPKVKCTLSLDPELKQQAIEAQINLSGLLEEALKQKLGLCD